MISWVDLTPTILDFAGAYDAKTQAVKPEISGSKSKPYRFHGRSFLSITEQTDPKGWDEIYASHTFHEITMYYPMRVVRTRKYKLIWNIAHPLPYPFASDLWAAPTFQDVYKREGLKGMYGKRTIGRVYPPPQIRAVRFGVGPRRNQEPGE
ncbi:MAG: hypothetical protein KatS3mg105_3833 [Gemmatales bacterium]|nr:MAG: hypothetical protein KatS3mg105_3833 [Gemmatales bacterium]